MEIGQHWGHRPPNGDLTEVEVLRIGVDRPPRVKVRFLDDRFEGREEWVKRVHLRTPWAELDAFLARDERWSRLLQETWSLDDGDFEAYFWVFERFVPRDMARVDHALAHRGALMVFDPPAFAALVGVQQHELSFDEGGVLHYPGSTALSAAREYVQRNSTAVLEEVRRIEEKERLGMAHGMATRSGFIDAEIVKQTYDEYWKPILPRVAEWCGGEALAEVSEIENLRESLRSATELVNEAIHELLEAGLERRAFALHRRMYPEAGSRSWKSVVAVRAADEERRRVLRQQLMEEWSSKRWADLNDLEVRQRDEREQFFQS